jgi:hypothetical protein
MLVAQHTTNNFLSGSKSFHYRRIQHLSHRFYSHRVLFIAFIVSAPPSQGDEEVA